MKRVCNMLLGIAVCIFLTSCASSYTVAIQTQEPAPFTFPGYVKSVLVVNNAVPQSPDHGVKLLVNKKEKDLPQALDVDTALWTAVNSLAQAVGEVNYFEKTLVYKNALRTDDQWLGIGVIPTEERQLLYEKTGTEAILSVDRVLFDLNQSVTTAGEDYFTVPAYIFLHLGTEVKLRCSVYLKSKEQPATVFTVADSLYFNAQVDNDSLIIFKELPNSILSHAGEAVGIKAASNFIPTWITTDRLVYSGSDSRLREADKYFNKENWKQAKAVWKAQFDSESKPKNKAKLAVNLAVVSEIEDHLDEALEWAKQSKTYYDQTNQVKKEEEIQWINQYIEILTKRIQNTYILNVQLEGDSN